MPGGRGVFDVVVDGRTIFSKHKEHRFPEHRQILETLKSLQH
jgi:selT/selW/selH-like putative selenoprotein